MMMMMMMMVVLYVNGKNTPVAPLARVEDAFFTASQGTVCLTV